MPTRELLSLFPVFDAIFAEESLSRAADRLGVSQSAVSQSLARLRQITSDELFQSTGRGMRPTPRAVMMIRHVRAALAEAEAAATPRELDLATLDRTFTLDIGAGLDALVLPGLYAEISASAPKVKLQITSLRAVDPSNALRTGEVELALDFSAPSAQGIRSQSLAPSPAVVIARAGHAKLKGGLSEAQYLQMGQVTLNWSRSIAPSGVALELKRLGREISSVLSVPTLTGLGAVVASCDLIATLSEGAARELCRRYPLAIFPLPFAMPRVDLFQLWHARFDEDPGHQWLRSVVEQVARHPDWNAHT